MCNYIDCLYTKIVQILCIIINKTGCCIIFMALNQGEIKLKQAIVQDAVKICKKWLDLECIFMKKNYCWF